MMLGFILLIIATFYMFSSNNTERSFFPNRQTQARNSLDILNDRYARGEISREEYLERKKDIS
ncbi:SHOCT domain-containing protein [Desulfosporosinus sp. FKA]|uniref:SHOCT domain-containing protein n=1 Tax=Desulfosporosinus sp. FKA TaxID=1969834 RepID=UPI000B49D54E|nr:SHOCT domain-containing protein [Desulfosporosinus sp. FKA]